MADVDQLSAVSRCPQTPPVWRSSTRSWLPAHLAGPSSQGWLEAFEKLDATLLDVQAVGLDAEV